MPIKLEPPLTAAQSAYIRAFSKIRHVKRNADAEEKHRDPVRKKAGLPVGKEGAYVVHDQESYGLIEDYNTPPDGQPDLYCQWFPEGRQTLVWKGHPDAPEDIYQAGDWLSWIATNILDTWGVKANGMMAWQDREGLGVVVVKDNDVREPEVSRTYVDPWSNEIVVIEEVEASEDDDDDDDEDEDDD